MKLTSKRQLGTVGYTLSNLYVDDVWECWILEDETHDGPKIPGKTSIPAGTYQIVMDYSNHFQKVLPHLLNVPDFEGIRIHPGNAPKDTEGCLLPGQTSSPGYVYNSRAAYDNLVSKIRAAISHGEVVTIEVS